jgi:hypothetical protein
MRRGRGGFDTVKLGIMRRMTTPAISTSLPSRSSQRYY